MAILYKHFLCLRTALSIFFCMIVFCVAGLGQARADSSIFTISNVKVDITAESAAAAREQAFAQAQIQAFQSLARRLVADGESAAITPPDPSVISTLIKDFEITDERLSRVRYVAVYTFRFKERASRDYFAGQGVGYTDVSSRPALVLPFYQETVKPVLWSDQNPWMSAWKRAGNLKGLVPIVVPIGDIEDLQDIGGDETMTYDPAALRRMLDRYNAGEAILLLAVPDARLAAISQDSSPVQGALTVHVYRTDRARPEHTGQIDVDSIEGETRGLLYDRAVQMVRDAIQRNWKAQTVVSAAETNSMQVKVRFENLKQWAETQKELERVQGVTAVNLVNLARDHALVNLMFQGSEERLRLALRQADITLSKPRIGTVSERMPLLYELYLNRYQPEDAQIQENVVPMSHEEESQPVATPVEETGPQQPVAEKKSWRERFWR